MARRSGGASDRVSSGLRGFSHALGAAVAFAETIATKFNNKYQPIYDELTKILGRFKGDDQDETFYKFLVSVREGKADLKPNVKPLVENSLSDRQLLRNIEYVRAESGRLERAFKLLEARCFVVEFFHVLDVSEKLTIGK